MEVYSHDPLPPLAMCTIPVNSYVNSAKRLWHEVSEWSQETLGDDSERGPIGPLKHLKLEADEAIESLESEEFADCLILIFDAARRHGFEFEDLIWAAIQKMAVNRKRTYPKPLTDEPSCHMLRSPSGMGMVFPDPVQKGRKKKKKWSWDFPFSLPDSWRKKKHV